MASIPIIGQESTETRIERMTANVIELLEIVPLGAEELIGIIELSLLDTISNLAGYTFEMQRQFLKVLGVIPEPGEPTAEEFVAAYIEDYTLLRMARTESLLRQRQELLTDAHEAVEGEE